MLASLLTKVLGGVGTSFVDVPVIWTIGTGSSGLWEPKVGFSGPVGRSFSIGVEALLDLVEICLLDGSELKFVLASWSSTVILPHGALSAVQRKEKCALNTQLHTKWIEWPANTCTHTSVRTHTDTHTELHTPYTHAHSHAQEHTQMHCIHT